MEQNKNLRQLNTFHMNVHARWFASFNNVEGLRELLTANRDKELLVLGGGSNILFTGDFGGLVLKNEICGIRDTNGPGDVVYVTAGAGENWHRFVLHTLEQGWYGLENLSLIPGNVGASPMQNIGAYGVEIKDVFHSLRALHIESGRVDSFDREACAFGYRESVFKRALKGQYIILDVTYELRRTPELHTSYGVIAQQLETMGIGNPGPKDVSNAVIAIRRSKLPDPAELGVEIKDVFHSLRALHIESGRVDSFDREACAFGYRESVFKRALKGQYIILDVTYELRRTPELHTSYGVIAQQLETMGIGNPGPKDVSNAVIAIRRSKLPDPAELGNAGSFFKNPVVPRAHYERLLPDFPEIPSYPVDEAHVKVPAGWLIEQSGWKGKRSGACGVHDRQALVLVNYGEADGKSVLQLSQDILDDVYARFGIMLEREVNIL